MKVTGGCHCGHIIYEAEVDPTTVRGLSLHGFPKTDRHGVSDQHCKSARNIRAEERDAKNLHQDRRKWKQARPRLLSGMRYADLFCRT